MSDASSHDLGWRPATYYPDPAIHALDPRFEKYCLKLSAVERLATGLRWAEGPVWFGDGRYLLCSDIPNQRIIKWEEETGAVSIYRKPSNFANGNTRDRQGRLVTCEHGGRRVIRVFDVNDDKLANGRAFITAEPDGTPDGFRCDVDGNLWCGWGMGSAQLDGVKIFDPSGKPIGFIALPERCANLCFGGVKRNRLFMAASHSLYSLYVNTQGAPGG